MSDIKKIKDEYLLKLSKDLDVNQINEIKTDLFGKNGLVSSQFKQLGKIPEDERKKFASELNEAKDELQNLIVSKIEEIEIGKSKIIRKGKKIAYLGETKILVDHALEKDGDFLLVVRPEKLFLSDKKSKDSNSFTGTIEDSIYQGESQLLIIRLTSASKEDQLLRMRIPNGSAALNELPSIGSKVSIGLKKSDSYLVE